ncbi:MAG: hypothetical protein CR975_01120, partial [Gammaproteobacteria bacterium]
MLSKTASDILSNYFWGQPTPPQPTDLRDEKFIRPALAETNYTVNANQYMNTGAGRYATPDRFKAFRDFFYEDKINPTAAGLNSLAPGVYNSAQISTALHGKDIFSGALGLSQYTTDVHSADYAERAYVFGSTSFEPDWGNIQFVIHPGGSREIRNLEISPQEDNFDFSSDSLLAKVYNEGDRLNMDPSSIGRKVNIDFSVGGKTYAAITKGDMDQMVQKTQAITYEFLDDLPEQVKSLADIRQDILNDIVIHYTDDQGYFVVYGTEGDDGSLQVNDHGKKAFILGSSGYDQYRVEGNDDIIRDSDGLGSVSIMVEKPLDSPLLGPITHKVAEQITGGEQISKGSNTYVSDDGKTTYVWDGTAGSTLIVNGGLQIENFNNGDLEINLTEKKDKDPNNLAPNISDAEQITSPIVIDMDKNGNGKIDNGNELFGNHAKLNNGNNAADGFSALAELDSNQDGKIDNTDAAWKDLRIWQDSNQNGITEQGEMQSLDDIGIKSIATKAADINARDDNDNDHLQTAAVTWNDGKSTVAEDIWFQVDTARTVNRNPVEISAEIKALPQVWAFGNVANLHTAMSQDSGLKDMVKTYIAADSAKRSELLDDLIYRWTGSEGIDPNSRDPSKIYGHVMDARQLVTLEHLVGRGYLGTWCWQEKDPNPHGQAAPKLIAEYHKFSNYVAATISDQADFGGVLSSLPRWHNTKTGNDEYNWQAFDQKIQTFYQQKQIDKIEALIDTAGTYGTYIKDYKDTLDNHLNELAVEVGGQLATLITEAGTYFTGSENADNISGNAKNNILEGYQGNDRLMGHKGNDIYHFSSDHGADTIYDSAGTDSIIFADKVITPASIRLTRDLTSVTLTHYDAQGKPTGNSIKIDNFYDFNGGIAEGFIEKIKFADGTVWTGQDIVRQLQPKPSENADNLYLDTANNTIDGLGGDDIIFAGDGNDNIDGGQGNDSLFGDNGNDTLNGGVGDDKLNGGNGNDSLNGGADNDTLDGNTGADKLDGGAGNDNLSGAAGNDQLIGGAGDDYLRGDTGSDNYVFAKGFGQDIIYNYNAGKTSQDSIQFIDGWQQSDFTFQRYGNGLVIAAKTTEDKVTVNNYFDNSGNYQVDQIMFSDKTTLDIKAVKFLVQQGSEQNDRLYADDGGSTLQGLGGNDRLYGASGADTLSGGEGNDYLKGDKGNDTLNGGLGNDSLIGDQGSDTYIFGKNFGQDSINNYDKSADRQDTIQFTEGWKQSDFLFQRYDQDLILASKTTEDKAIIGNYFSDDDYRVDQVVFSNGKKLEFETIKDLVLKGTEQDDHLYAYDSGSDIKGLGGNDIIYGASGADKLSGGGGNDYLRGDKGNDNLSGGDGKDSLYGEAGDDRLDGGAGNDRLYGDHGYYGGNTDGGDDTLTGGSGNDELYGGAGSDSLDGGAGNDTLRGDRGNDTLIGGTGNDKLDGSAGDDQLDGGIGDDKLIAGIGNDTLIGGAGNDSLLGGDGNDTLTGGAGDDTLNGGTGSDTYHFAKGWGNDAIKIESSPKDTENNQIIFTDILPTDILVRNEGGKMMISRIGSEDKLTVDKQFNLYGNAKENISHITFADGTVWDLPQMSLAALKGTANADTIIGVTDNDIIHAGDGDDTVSAWGNSQIFGEKGDDNLQGGKFVDGGVGNDTLSGYGEVYGREGNDTLSGSGTLDGGAGDDNISGDGKLYGGDGDDKLSSYYSSSLLDGGAGNDTLSGSGELHGRDGNDTLDGSGKLYGGKGSDQLNLTDAGTADGGAGDDTLDAGDSVEIPFGDDGAGMLAPVKGDIVNTLRGGKGDDTIYGSYGNDVYEFNLGDGRDTIIETRADVAYSNVKASYDIIRFGADIAVDDIQILHRGSDLVLQHSNGTDSITVKEHFNTTNRANIHYKIDELQFADGTSLNLNDMDSKTVWRGTDNADQMLGSGDKAETIYAGGGDDKIFARGGDDVIYGEAGKDYIDAEAGNDRLFGGSGDDSLRGGKGNDILDGGQGDDHYVYRPNEGQDVIDQNGGGRDILFFSDGIGKDRLSFSKEGDDLLITVDNDANQSVRVKGHFLGGDKAISMVQPDGGYGITAKDIDQLVGVAADNTNPPADNNHSDTPPTDTQPADNSAASSQTGTDGNDTLQGEAGNDILSGGLGDDTYIYSGGQDTLIDSGGVDKVIFGADIAFADVGQHLIKSGDDFIIRVKGDAGNDLRMQDFFSDGNKTIE